MKQTLFTQFCNGNRNSGRWSTLPNVTCTINSLWIRDFALNLNSTIVLLASLIPSITSVAAGPALVVIVNRDCKGGVIYVRVTKMEPGSHEKIWFFYRPPLFLMTIWWVCCRLPFYQNVFMFFSWSKWRMGFWEVHRGKVSFLSHHIQSYIISIWFITDINLDHPAESVLSGYLTGKLVLSAHPPSILYCLKGRQ